MSAFHPRRFSRPEVIRRIAPDHLLQFLDPYREYLLSQGVRLPAAAPLGRFELVWIIAKEPAPHGVERVAIDVAHARPWRAGPPVAAAGSHVGVAETGRRCRKLVGNRLPPGEAVDGGGRRPIGNGRVDDVLVFPKSDEVLAHRNPVLDIGPVEPVDPL